MEDQTDQPKSKPRTLIIMLIFVILILGIFLAVMTVMSNHSESGKQDVIKENKQLQHSVDSVVALKDSANKTVDKTKHLYDGTFNMIMAEYHLVLAVDSYACDSMSRKRLKMAITKIGNSINNINQTNK